MKRENVREGTSFLLRLFILGLNLGFDNGCGFTSFVALHI